jgi:aminoglycoside phosphotransferase (APT) family kinase protein
MIFDRREPRVLALLDWELSTLGDPLADFAYHLMTWRLAPDEFRGLRGCDFAGLGIPSEDEYVARYLDANPALARPDDQAWDFYMAYNMFRMAGILQGVLARGLAGNAASAQALEAGRRARPLAELAWRQVEQGRSRAPRR